MHLNQNIHFYYSFLFTYYKKILLYSLIIYMFHSIQSFLHLKLKSYHILLLSQIYELSLLNFYSHIIFLIFSILLFHYHYLKQMLLSLKPISQVFAIQFQRYKFFVFILQIIDFLLNLQNCQSYYHQFLLYLIIFTNSFILKCFLFFSHQFQYYCNLYFLLLND